MTVEDFESATIVNKSTKPSWEFSNSNLWMCGASNGEQEEKKYPFEDQAYIPEPFPNEKFELDA